MVSPGKECGTCQSLVLMVTQLPKPGDGHPSPSDEEGNQYPAGGQPGRLLSRVRPAWDDCAGKKGTHSSALPRLSKGKTIKEELKQVVDTAEDVTNSRILEV